MILAGFGDCKLGSLFIHEQAVESQRAHWAEGAFRMASVAALAHWLGVVSNLVCQESVEPLRLCCGLLGFALESGIVYPQPKRASGLFVFGHLSAAPKRACTDLSSKFRIAALAV